MDEAARLVAARPRIDDPTLARVLAVLRQRFGLREGAMRLGRYELLHTLGSGGTGTVWAALDRRLGRRVAIKTVTRPGLDRRFVLREARALAQLSHPNVVECLDVGIDGAVIYLVMELVQGTSLAQWLADAAPSRREILRVFAAAAAGLAAAHAVGIAHCDVKPANILLGADGRVRVVDFGLASAARVPSTENDGDFDEDGGARGLGGTLPYMAPEQHDGGGGSTAVDVFAFSAALYEAFAGVRAFAGSTATELLHAKLERRLQAPRPDREVPDDVLAAVIRGLAPDPRLRPSDIMAVVAPLRPRAHARALVGFGLGAVLLATGLASAGAPERDPCVELRHALAVPLAADAEIRGMDLDRYAAQLRDATSRTCTAWERGETSRLRRDTELECLARLHQAADELARAFANTHASASDRVVARVQLPAVESCDDPSVVVAPARDDERIAATTRALARASAASSLLRGEEARVAAREALALASELDRNDLVADALFELGRADSDRGESARATLRESYWLATSTGRDRTAAAAASWLVLLDGQEIGGDDAATEWMRHAESALARIGGDPWIEAKLWDHVALLRTRRGDGQGALAADELALARWQSLAESDGAAMIQPLVTHAAALRAAGRMDEALRVARDAREIALTEHGADDPMVFIATASVAAALHDLGDFAESRREQAVAVAGLRRELGDDDPRTSTARGNFARLLLRAGEYEAARLELEELLARRRATNGPRHPDVAKLLAELGTIDTRLGRWTQGEARLREAVEIFEAAAVPDARVIEAYGGLATAAAQAGRQAETIAWLQRSVTLSTATHGPDHPDTLETSAYLGRATAEGGAEEDGLALLDRVRERLVALHRARDVAELDVDRAIVLRKLERHDESIAAAQQALAWFSAGGAEHEVADAQIVLAKSLLAAGRDRARVRALGREACAFYRRVAAEFPRQMAECVRLGFAAANAEPAAEDG